MGSGPDRPSAEIAPGRGLLQGAEAREPAAGEHYAALCRAGAQGPRVGRLRGGPRHKTAAAATPNPKKTGTVFLRPFRDRAIQRHLAAASS